MGSLKKRRKAKINKHKRSKRMRQNRHKKRLRYKSSAARLGHVRKATLFFFFTALHPPDVSAVFFGYALRVSTHLP